MKEYKVPVGIQTHSGEYIKEIITMKTYHIASIQ
jgi:hypothetical protein